MVGEAVVEAAVLRWTGELVSNMDESERGELLTLHARLDNVEGVHDQRCDRPGRQPGDGLDEGG